MINIPDKSKIVQGELTINHQSILNFHPWASIYSRRHRSRLQFISTPLSKVEVHGQLKHAWAAQRLLDETKRCRRSTNRYTFDHVPGLRHAVEACAGAGHVEVGMVEDIERFSPELEAAIFAEPCFLREGHIESR